MRRRSAIEPPVPRVDIDPDEARALVELVRHQPLQGEQHAKLAALVETFLWFAHHAKGNPDYRWLFRLVFGPNTEKTSVLFPEPPGAAQGEVSAARSDAPDAHLPPPDPKPKPKGHGREPAAAYRGAEKVLVPHECLKPGDGCPGCQRGKVYEMAVPAVLVRVRGGAPLGAKVYAQQRLRCNLCLEVYVARPPADAGEAKYDDTAAAMIAVLRYGTGQPFNRTARLQRSLGIPLPASTQWDVVNAAARFLLPAHAELTRQAAQGHVMHNDDTGMTVLALTGKRRAREAPSDDPADRTGMFTTGIISRVGERLIALYITGRKHAGENLEDVLKHRAAELGPPIQMCDALSRNVPEFATILANCMSHGRRNFIDVVDNFPVECRHVIDTLAKVFHHDAITRKEKMSDEQRLIFHQTHSGPLMDGLAVWFRQQFEERKVEPNSGLGEAFSYMLKHWAKLTLFLRVPGAPLDNNVVERTLKRAIMHRKNSLFYRTLNGARVGDLFMSFIHTAELSGADPFDYLVTLLRNAEAVEQTPADWMPWNYKQTLAQLAAKAA